MNLNELKPEQKRAIFHENGDILVSASAGSGKTFVMINRLIRLIAEGKAKAENVLAVTFTEAAAADMKNKLKRALEEEIAGGKVSLAEELGKIATADICTLHSFCARLIRTYFFAAGVAPDYKVIDQNEAYSLKRESADELFGALYEENDAEFKALAERYRYHRKDDALKQIITDLYDLCESEADPAAFLYSFEKNYTREGALKISDKFSDRLTATAQRVKLLTENLIKDCDRADFSAGKEQALYFYGIISEIVSGGAKTARFYADKELPKITAKKPAAASEDLKERLKKIKSDIKSLCEFALSALIDESELLKLKENAASLVKTVERFSAIYAEKKRENNALDFSDLERFALKALKNEEVKTAVRQKYAYVFVDEYQDVNGVQEEIISAVSNGNCFMVGDAKQSIYGFRGCRSEIFESKEKLLTENGGATVNLNYNFRSAQNVIDFINKIFDYCYVKEYTGVDYKSTARLKNGGIYPVGAEGRAALHWLTKQKTDRAARPVPHVYDLLKEAFNESEKEAASISNLLTDIIDDELTKTFYDIKTKTFKRVTMQDIAILTRAGDTAYVKGIVEGLNGHGIRARSSVSQNVCDFPEIKTLINALKLVDCFYDDAPLVGTLLSVIGGFTEEDLTDVALYFSDAGQKGGFTDAFFYYAENAKTPLKERLVDFKARFDRLRFIADFKGAKGVLDEIISDCGYENYILAEAFGEEKLRRLYKFTAETVSAGKIRTVAEFLRRVENLPKAFEISGGGEEDAVNVMTIHSSKGLEFPVVIVCGLEKKFSKKEETRPLLFDRDEGFFAYSFDEQTRSLSTNGYREAIKAKLRDGQIKEEMRLFYVALTRAEYSLHLVFEQSADDRANEFCNIFTDSACFTDFIPASVKAEEHSPKSFGLSSFKRGKRQILIVKPDEKKALELKKDFAYEYPFIEATELPLKTAVTATLKNQEPDGEYTFNLFPQEEKTDATKGVIAHKIMENLNFFGADVTEQVKDMVKNGTLDSNDAESVLLSGIVKAVNSGVFAGLKDKRLYREQDFIVSIEGEKAFGFGGREEVLLQGVIDLLAVSDEGAEILDYKYSNLKGERLKEKYSKQLNLYAYAVEKALGLKVIRKTLVNILTGETVSVS